LGGGVFLGEGVGIGIEHKGADEIPGRGSLFSSAAG